MKTKLGDKWLIPPILILGFYFLIRLIDQSMMIFRFPLDYTNDLSSFMARVAFLIKCGFHNFCPYWYNGFKSFLLNPPGWEFFTYPLTLLTNNLQLATYISLILMYILAFVFLFYLGKTQKITFTKIILFFLLLFANPITIGNFIRLGRYPSLFAWVNFIALAAIILYYKDKPLNKRFLLSSIFFAIILISHQPEAVLSSILFLSIFLVKERKEKIYVLFSAIFGFILSSFWTVPFILNSSKENVLADVMTTRLFDFTGQWALTNIATFIVSFGFLITFYLYLKTKYFSKKEILFFIPILLINLLLLFRVISFLPILKFIFPDEYMFFLIFFSTYFLLKSRYPQKLKHLLVIGLILISIVALTVSLYHTPWFKEPSNFENVMLSLAPDIPGKYVILGNDFTYNGRPSYETVLAGPYYSYTAIYHNKSTSFGWDFTVSPKWQRDLEYEYIPQALEDRNCANLITQLKKVSAEVVITFNEHCDFLSTCNINKNLTRNIDNENFVCIYSL